MENTRPGDSSRITREYTDSLLIEMRQLDAVMPSTRMELFGRTFDTPIATAAFSHLSNFGYHKDGMVELAKGAQMANALNFVGMGPEEELERIVDTGVAAIKIVKPYADNEIILRKLEHAKRVGAIAVGMDIDHAFGSEGEFDVVLGEPMCPKTTEEIRMFASAAGLPFVVKGVLSVTDALKCVEAGAKGIIVSHHHGIMDYAVPPLMILPEIVKAIGPDIAVFADSGIATGYDVFKALALGATGACAGTAMLNSLKEGGKEGACEWIRRQTGVLKSIMGRTASPDIRHIDASLIWRR
nr:alpha-hydroxy acid oxidase [bacterium]